MCIRDRKKGVTQDVELTAEDLKELAGQFKAEYKSKIGEDFPSDPVSYTHLDVYKRQLWSSAWSGCSPR